MVVRWGGLGVAPEAGASVARMECVVEYGTRGEAPLRAVVAAAGTMGRGRALAAMDAELAKALTAGDCEKQSFAGMSVAGALVGPSGVAAPAAAPVDLGSKVWWGEPQFGAETEVSGRVSRVVRVSIWALV